MAKPLTDVKSGSGMFLKIENNSTVRCRLLSPDVEEQAVHFVTDSLDDGTNVRRSVLCTGGMCCQYAQPNSALDPSSTAVYALVWAYNNPYPQSKDYSGTIRLLRLPAIVTKALVAYDEQNGAGAILGIDFTIKKTPKAGTAYGEYTFLPCAPTDASLPAEMFDRLSAYAVQQNILATTAQATVATWTAAQWHQHVQRFGLQPSGTGLNMRSAGTLLDNIADAVMSGQALPVAGAPQALEAPRHEGVYPPVPTPATPRQVPQRTGVPPSAPNPQGQRNTTPMGMPPAMPRQVPLPPVGNEHVQQPQGYGQMNPADLGEPYDAFGEDVPF